MHRKHSKYNHHKDHHQISSSKKIHVKCKKDGTDIRLDVPQNSRSDVIKNNDIVKENTKHKHHHKHKNSEEAKSGEHHGKSRHDRKAVCNIADVQGLVLGKEVNHKEKKEKRDKERLNKIEKYLEGLDKACSKKVSHNRSHSLGSSESVFKNQNEPLRREKNFHEKLKRHASTNSHLNIPRDKESEHVQRKKSSKKHKNDHHKERESSKEKNSKDPTISYCQVETQNPFEHKKKKYDVERLYPEESHIINERSSRRRSSSKDSCNSPTRENLASKHHKNKNKESSEKKNAPIKSKVKNDLKNCKDQKSDASLGPYRKYFAFDKKTHVEKEVTRQKKKKHCKVDSTERTDKENRGKKESKVETKAGNPKKTVEKACVQTDQYKDKIEDDIKSYFTKIQALIDKKLDFILGNSNSKETKSSSVENDLVAEKSKSKKGKKEEKEYEKPNIRGYPKKEKIEKLNTREVERKEKPSEDPARLKYFEERKEKFSDDKLKHYEERKTKVESKRVKNSRHGSRTSLKRERYPSVDSETHTRRPSPEMKWPGENYPPPGNNNEPRQQEKSKKSPSREFKDFKARPEQIINMLEHPSSFSLCSKTSATKDLMEEESKLQRAHQNQRGVSGSEHHDRRGSSATRDDFVATDENYRFKELEQAFLQEAYAKKIKKRSVEKPFIFTVKSNTHLKKEQCMAECKYEAVGNHVVPEVPHQKREKSLTKKHVIRDEEELKMKQLEQAYMQELQSKKMKKRMRQLMNLECKTVSIVGIPSQARESTIINETQTTTSLNVINQVEDSIEKKKKSKRFKLYYKYSVADNKCPNESDKSSDDKKSIISDSHRVISDPSDHNVDIWEDAQDEPNAEDKQEEPENIHFIMKNRKFNNHCGDASNRHHSVERPLKKYRKRSESPNQTLLNNILEEPSNISIIVRHNDTPILLDDNLNCSFFNDLRSSSSHWNLEPPKKDVRSCSPHRQKNRHVDKHLTKTTTKSKSPSRKEHEKEHHHEFKPEKKPKFEPKIDPSKKIKKMESQQKIKRKPRNSHMGKFASKSDIDITYESVAKYKHNVKKKADGASNLREQLKHLLPELPVRKASPERKSIDVILKEELRQILKEIPRSMVCKETSFDDVTQIEPPKPVKKCIEEETEDQNVKNGKNPNENQKLQQTEEKQCCSRKVGTHQGMTKIPSLIKGYVAKTPSHGNHCDIIETRSSTKELYQDVEQQEEIEEPEKREFIDTATEIDANREGIKLEEATDIILESKMSQTPPPKVDMGVEVQMDTIARSKTSKRISHASKVKRCQILDPFTNPKLGYTIKPTRPIINLENNNFPARKAQESSDGSRPASSQYKRQKSSLSEGRAIKFERRETFLDEKPKPIKQRPVSVEKEAPKKVQRIPTKSALTMSTNVITINSSAYVEEPAETYDAQMRSSKKSNVVTPNVNKKHDWDKRAVTAGNEKRRVDQALGSKSALSLNDVDAESKIGSLVSVDKFSNYDKLNLSSNSNAKSLDQYTVKSIINDNPQSSRLFLTKNFSTQMNTYQRRKMYDESMRKKMKKKMGNQNQMGPRIYEVRYVTLENENLNDNSDANGSHKSVNKFPTFSTKINKPRQRNKVYKPFVKKSRKGFPKNKEDACKFSGRDIFAPVIADVDQLNKFRRKTFPEKQVEEIFFKNATSKKDETVQDDVQSSSAETDEKNDSSDELRPTTVNKDNVDPNFKELIDCLYNSIISYCNSKFKLQQEGLSTPKEKQQIIETREVSQEKRGDSKPPPINEISYVVFPKPSQEKRNHHQLSSAGKNSPSGRNVSSKEKQSKPLINQVCDHLSCPVLAGSSSSFDYLYEDGSIELDKEAVLLHFRKPMKTILGYAFNNTHHVPKQTLLSLHKRDDQNSNSATESEESGYSSTNSKKCTSVCSFFKKPSIANLFKPVRKLEGGLLSTTSSVVDSRSGPNLQEYDVMNQKCKEYAEKVRVQSQSKDGPGEAFQEIPLDVLLFCRQSCTRLGDFNSNCSLCKKHSCSDLPDITESDELNHTVERFDRHLETKNSLYSIKEEDSTRTLSKSKVEAETLIFYEGIDHKQSLEIISFQKSQTSLTNDNNSQLIKEMAECPVVLSITNLNTCSLTIIEESPVDDIGNTQLKNDGDIKFDVVENESNHAISIRENGSATYISSSTPIDFDGRSDISSCSGFRRNHSASASKYMAKRFFDNLLKVYEKEINVTNKLFQDEEFFTKILLESIKSEEATKTKNNTFKKLIKGKLKNCIGSVFSPKNSLDHDIERLGTKSPADSHQRKLQILASDARQYFSMFVQAVKTNKDINDEVKICGLLKLLERIEDGDFAVLRRKEDVDFEEEIREQVKEAFVNIYQISIKEAKKRKRSLTANDLKLIRTFVSKYRIGLLSKTDLIASYIGRGVFKTEGHLKAAVTYLIQHNKKNAIDLKEFDQQCKVLGKCNV